MALKEEQVRFCAGRDRVGLAFSVTGSGMPLLRAPHWITHLNHDTSVWGHLYDEVARRFSFVRFDQRGCGLSDRNVSEISFESWVHDVESVADAAQLKRFAILGVSQGAAIAVAFAARHPERVSHLILYGGYAEGWANRDLSPRDREKLNTLGKLIELGWSGWDASLRQVFTMQLMPGANVDQARALNELMHVSASTETALGVYDAFNSLDVREEAKCVTCPTLVLHATGDRRVPFEDGRALASLIPNARFVPLDSDNHLLLPGEPATARFFEAIDQFIPQRSLSTQFAELTAREQDVLEYVAQGLDNAQIAARLQLAEKTIRNNLVSIFDKLQVENRAQAIVRAREAGWGTKVR